MRMLGGEVLRRRTRYSVGLRRDLVRRLQLLPQPSLRALPRDSLVAHVPVGWGLCRDERLYPQVLSFELRSRWWVTLRFGAAVCCVRVPLLLMKESEKRRVCLGCERCSPVCALLPGGAD